MTAPRKPRTAAQKLARNAKARATSNPNGNPAHRPKALTADEATIRLIGGMGKIQATHEECGALLGVCAKTFVAFLANPDVAEAYERGKALGRASLRRKQYDMALAGNTTMLVWTGKNILGQTDKLATELTGKDGGAIQLEQVNADAESFTRAIAGLAARAAEDAGTGEAKP